MGKYLGIGGVAALPVLCCAGPSLLAGLGSVSVASWLVPAGYILAPLALLAGTAAAILFYRRRRSAVAADGCCSAVGSAGGCRHE